MATFVLHANDVFAAGTSVSAYTAVAGSLPPTGVPVGAVASSAVVAADGTATFTGLADGVKYWAYAAGRVVSFTTDPVATGGGVSQAALDLVESGRGARTWITGTAYPQFTILTDGTSTWRVLVTGYTSGASIAADVTANKLALLPGAASAPDATTGVKGIVQLANDLAGTSALPTVPGKADKADGAWQLDFDSGMTNGAAATSVLGTLFTTAGRDLYLFGSSGESAGAMQGVWRKRAGASTWLQLSTLASPARNFNRDEVWGASEFKGKLYVGDRNNGHLYRLDLHATNVAADGGPAFTALTDLGAEFVGAEDIFPGPVLWGKLYLGNFGNENTPPNYQPPGIYRYDGTTVTQVLRLNAIGNGGQVISQTVYDGALWISAMDHANGTPTFCEVWAIQQDDTCRLMYSGPTFYKLATWNGELVGADDSNPGQFVVWSDTGFIPLAPSTFGNDSSSPSQDAVLPIDDELWYLSYYYGLWRFGWDSVPARGGANLGATEPGPAGASGASTNMGGVTSLKVHDDYIYAATTQPVKVWRKRLGTNRAVRARNRPQKSSAAARPVLARAQLDSRILALTPYVYLDASAVAGNDGDLVSTWPNKGSLGAVTATGTGRPTLRKGSGKGINSQAALEFDGAATFMVLPSLAALANATIIAVLKADRDIAAAATSAGLWRLGTDAGAASLYPFTDGSVYDEAGTTARKALQSVGRPRLTDAHIYTVRSATNDWTAGWDGAPNTFVTANTVGFSATPWIGKGVGSTNFFLGRFAWIGIFPLLTAVQEALVYSILREKYRTPA